MLISEIPTLHLECSVASKCPYIQTSINRLTFRQSVKNSAQGQKIDKKLYHLEEEEINYTHQAGKANSLGTSMAPCQE